ncbi:MAG: extracellular solute-binding protein [Elusimicrobiota bacterium]|nr:extracellular solute-binding protein [Elusimicrobiota bacterium]
MLKERIIFSVLFSGLLAAASAPALAFDPAGWETSGNYPLLGSPEAKKGGALRSTWLNFPPTLRALGPNYNTSENGSLQDMVYESLLMLHPETLEYIPALADYWKISPDRRKFYFHINPKARWADGSPVTAADVVASWEFKVRKDIKDPFSLMMWGESYEKPVAESAGVVSVKTKKLHWRLFMYFSASLQVYQAKELKGLTGEKYLEDYNWKLLMGSGPYELKQEDIKKDHSVTLTRRAGYWGEKERRNIGRNNFDKLTWLVVRDEELAFEKFKKGELDYYFVNKAQKWLEETNFDKVRKGWIQKRKIYTKIPQGFSGLVFNMRKPPFNDRNVRKAFSYLYNRDKLIDKLFFNEYGFIDSYYPGSDFGNPDNPKIRYNPRMAKRLLARAGWKTRNKDGWLEKDGKIFEIMLEYGDPGYTRINKVIQGDFKKAGIKLDLKLMDRSALMKKVGERNFTIYSAAWGALQFPNPVSSWGGEFADKTDNNNLPGFKNDEVDALCKEYDLAFDLKTQKRLIRRIDGLIFRAHPYALGWSSGYSRILYFNKFGHPEKYFYKIGDYRGMISLWWADPLKEKALNEAMNNGVSLPVGETVQRPWD